MKSFIAVFLCVAMCVCIIFCLFTGNLTVEQLIAMGLAVLLVNGVLDEIRARVAMKREQEE